METLRLRYPKREDKGQLEHFVKLLKEKGQSPNGFAFMENFSTFEEWLNFITVLREDLVQNESIVPSDTYVLERMVDGKVVGITDIRHRLTPALELKGGHIGFSVIPNEQGKGYGNEILRLSLEKAKELGIDRVLLVCEEENIPSRKTMEHWGGELLKKEDREDKTFLYFAINQ